MTHSLNPGISYTVNLYHTTSSVLINGKSPEKFIDDDLPEICKNINGSLHGNNFSLHSISRLLQTKLYDALQSFRLTAGSKTKQPAVSPPNGSHIPDSRTATAPPLSLTGSRSDERAETPVAPDAVAVQQVSIQAAVTPAVSTQGSSLVNNMVITTSSSTAQLTTAVASTNTVSSAPIMSVTSSASQITDVNQLANIIALSSIANPAGPVSIPITIDASTLNQLMGSNSAGGTLPTTIPVRLPTSLQGPAYAPHGQTTRPYAPQQLAVGGISVANDVTYSTASAGIPPIGGLPQPAFPVTDTLSMAESRIKKLQTKVTQQEAELVFKANQHKAEQKRISSLELQNNELRQTIKLRDMTIETQNEKIKSLEAAVASYQERIRTLEAAAVNQPFNVHPSNPYPSNPHSTYPVGHQCCQSSQGASQPIVELLVKELLASRHQQPQIPLVQPQPQVIPMPMPMPYPMYMPTPPPMPMFHPPPKAQGKFNRPRGPAFATAHNTQPNHQAPPSSAPSNHTAPTSVPNAPVVTTASSANQTSNIANNVGGPQVPPATPHTASPLIPPGTGSLAGATLTPSGFTSPTVSDIRTPQFSTPTATQSSVNDSNGSPFLAQRHQPNAPPIP